MWDKGYSATSPREVRERAGVGQGSMYHHFPSKHALGLAALRRTCQALTATAVAPLDETQDPLQALEAYITRPRQALRGCRVGRMTQDRAVVADDALREPVAEAFATTHEVLAQMVRRAIDSGQLSAHLDADRVARTIVATIQGGYVLAIAAQDAAPYEAACAGLLELLRAAAPSVPETSHINREEVS